MDDGNTKRDQSVDGGNDDDDWYVQFRIMVIHRVRVQKMNNITFVEHAHIQLPDSIGIRIIEKLLYQTLILGSITFPL